METFLRTSAPKTSRLQASALFVATPLRTTPSVREQLRLCPDSHCCKIQCWQCVHSCHRGRERTLPPRTCSALTSRPAPASVASADASPLQPRARSVPKASPAVGGSRLHRDLLRLFSKHAFVALLQFVP